MSNDACDRYKAQRILRPHEENMRYTVAVLRAGRSDGAGRNLRTSRHLNYNEARSYAQRGREAMTLGDDHGRIQLRARWGWRLHEQMVRAFDGNM